MKSKKDENKKEMEPIEKLVKYIFKKNEKIICISITATMRKKRNGWDNKGIGSKINGLSYRRQDFVKLGKDEVKG